MIKEQEIEILETFIEWKTTFTNYEVNTNGIELCKNIDRLCKDGYLIYKNMDNHESFYRGLYNPDLEFHTTECGVKRLKILRNEHIIEDIKSISNTYVTNKGMLNSIKLNQIQNSNNSDQDTKEESEGTITKIFNWIMSFFKK